MDTQITIRIEELETYTLDIEKSINNLTVQLDPEYQPLSASDAKEMIENESTHLILAYDGDKIVGMLTLIVYRIPYRMKAWIEDVVVDESYRGRGIGESLLTTGIEKARSLHVSSLNLTSNPKRNAESFYLRLGFEKRNTNVFRLIL